MKGGAGADVVDSTDGGKDRARGGRGQDTCFVNKADKARGCEQKVVVA